jgi:hypothetical protein
MFIFGLNTPAFYLEQDTTGMCFFGDNPNVLWT